MNDLELTLRGIRDFSMYKSLNYRQACSLTTALLRPPVRIKYKPCPPRPRELSVIHKPIEYKAFQLNEWTYHSILTWPEWLQQTDIIRIENGGRLWWDFRVIKVNDWMVFDKTDKYPFIVGAKDFAYRYQIESIA